MRDNRDNNSKPPLVEQIEAAFERAGYVDSDNKPVVPSEIIIFPGLD